MAYNARRLIVNKLTQAAGLMNNIIILAHTSKEEGVERGCVRFHAEIVTVLEKAIAHLPLHERSEEALSARIKHMNMKEALMYASECLHVCVAALRMGHRNGFVMEGINTYGIEALRADLRTFAQAR